MDVKTWQGHRTETLREDRREWLQVIAFGSLVVLAITLLVAFGR